MRFIPCQMHIARAPNPENTSDSAGPCPLAGRRGAGGWYLVGRGPDSAVQPGWAGALWNFATTPRRNGELELEPRCEIGVGDPIFADQGGGFRQIGEVTFVLPQPGRPRVQAVFYATAPPLSSRSVLTYHQTPDSFEWVLRTMLPAEKRKQIADELKLAFDQNREEVLRQLRPVVEGAIRAALSAVEQEVPQAIARHRDDLERLGGKYQREILERQIVPLVRSEVWPIVRRHAEPMANEVGQEIWQRASLWRFGWRYAYDKSPLPQRDLTQQEWQRFVRQEAVPVLQSHTEDFVRVQQQIVRELAADPKVRAAVSGSLNQIASDPERSGSSGKSSARRRRTIRGSEPSWKTIGGANGRKPRSSGRLSPWNQPSSESASCCSARLKAASRPNSPACFGTRFVQRPPLANAARPGCRNGRAEHGTSFSSRPARRTRPGQRAESICQFGFTFVFPFMTSNL